MKKRLVVWGAGMQARIVADIIRQGNEFEIAGFLDNVNPERIGSPFEGALVGIGAVVLKDIAAYSVAYGVPARVIRRVRENEV